MPYTTPSTISTGQMVPASLMNNEWANNIKFLADPPACRAYHSTTQAIASGTKTGLVFDSERFDTDSMHSTTTNTGRITVNTAGLYLFSAHVGWAANVTGFRIVYLTLNAGSDIAIQSTQVRSDGFLDFSVATIWKCAVADFVTVSVYQNSGSTINVNNSNYFTTEFAASWIGLA
jgi:hypothetical protein